MGIGMIAVVDSARAEELRSAAGEECWILGELAAVSPPDGKAAPARTRLS